MFSHNGFPLIAMLIILSLSLAACGGAPTTAAPAATQPPQATAVTPLRFGVIEPLTGGVSQAGNFIKTGIELAVANINSNGGVNGQPLEAVFADGKCDPQESANAAELLITRDKVPVIIGAYCSSATLAVMAVLDTHGVPLLVETSSSSKITADGTPGSNWVHRISPTSQMEAQAVETYLIKDLHMNRVAHLAVNNDWGRDAAAMFKAAIEGQGGTVISQDFIDSAAVDFMPQLTAIKAAGADSIIITTDAPQVAGILKQYQELAMTQTVMTTGGDIYPKQMVKLASMQLVEGMYTLLFWVPGHPELAGSSELSTWYEDQYKARGNDEIGLGESFRGFDAVSVLAKAFELANGSQDPAKLNEALGNVEMDVLSGHVKFDIDGGRQSKPNVYIVQIKSGDVSLPDFLKK